VVLGEIALQLAQHAGARAEHRRELGGTRVVWSALTRGDVDVYAEYTGTLREEVFAGEPLPDDEALRARLAKEGLAMTDPLGFDNTYAIGLK
jgi:osmoprotectant transport system permease protein